MSRSEPRPDLARRVLKSVLKADAVVQRAFALLVTSAGRFTKGGAQSPLDPLFHAALRRKPNGAALFQGVAASAALDKELHAWLEKTAGKLDGPAVPIDFDKLAAGAARGEKGKEGAGKEGKPEGKPAKDGETPPAKDGNKPETRRETYEVERNGTVVRVSVETPVGLTTQSGREGDDARDEPDATRYGEEIEAGKELYAISIHTIECVETTFAGGWLAATAMIGAAAGVDDEIAWVTKDMTANFEGQIHVPIQLASVKVHADIGEGDVLSDMNELCVPDDEQGTHRLGQGEVFLVNRYFYTARGRSQDGVHATFVPFDLAKFESMSGDFYLLEDDSDVKEWLEAVLMLLGELARVAMRAADNLGGPGVALLRAVLEEVVDSDAFARLNAVLQEMISSSDVIGSCTFRVVPGQIEDAFHAGPIQRYPLGRSKPAFEYVTDMAEQTYELKGKMGHYRVKLRFQRYAATS